MDFVRLFELVSGETRYDATADWFMASQWPTMVMVALYLAAIVVGPRLMRTRKAFDLKHVIIGYNVCIVILTLYMVEEFFVSAWLRDGFSIACQPVEHLSNSMALRLARVCWLFFLSKIIELLDTIFFILRNKSSHITFLHVYHHATMPILWWISLRFGPGGSAFFGASLNCLVHVLMYSYYLLAALGPRVQPYLWWKKYLTLLQLTQFVIVIGHTGLVIYLDCGYPRVFAYMLFVYMVSQLVLFLNFYYKNYTIKPKRRRAQNGTRGDDFVELQMEAGKSNGFKHD